VHPVERLRYLALSRDADTTSLVAEVVRGLADLADDPRAIAMGARRLLEAQPDCGPLWWAASRMLAAIDVREERIAILDALSDDSTADELAAAFPSSSVVVASAGEAVLMSLLVRPDLEGRLVGDSWSISRVLRHFDAGAEVSAWVVDEVVDAVAGATVCCVEGLAAASSGVLLGEVDASLVAAATRAGVPVWLVAGAGRVLPAPLFDALVRRVGLTGHANVVEPATFAVVVGPDGALPGSVGLSRSDCPVAYELTR